MTEIEKINIELREIHKILSGKDEIPPLKFPVYTTMIYDSGIQGKLISNGTIDPDSYYKLTIDGK